MGAVLYRDKIAVHERLLVGGILSEADQLLIVREHGILAALLFFDIDPREVGVLHKPGVAGRKARVRVAAPLHRCARVVAAKERQRFQRLLLGNAGVDGHLVGVDGGDVVQFLHGADLLVLHADLLALINEGQSAAEEVNGGKRFFARFRAHLGRQIAAGASGLVVVLDDGRIEADVADLLLGAEKAAPVGVDIDALGVKPALAAAAVELGGEVEHGGKIAAVADKERQILLLFVEDFAHRKGVVGCEGFVPHLAQELSDAFRLQQHVVDGGQAVLAVRGIIVQNRRLLDVDDRIDAEAADPLLHPPADVLVHFLAEHRVLPVEVGLLFVKDMHVELVRARQLVPAGAAKIGAPVGRKLALGVLVPQVKIAAVLSVRVLAGLFEPLVLV